jgi:glutaredoxin
MAKDFLKKNKVKFTSINVNEDHKAGLEMVKKSGQTGVPVIDIDGEIIVGFNQTRLKQLLKLK